MIKRIGLAVEWTLATTAAVVAAHLAVEIVGSALLGYYLLFLLPFVGGVVGGVPVGVLQWMVLRRRVTASGPWMAFTLIGFVGAWTAAVALAAVLFVPRLGLDSSRAFLSFAVPTPIIGLAQARMLRRWGCPTRWWVIASAAGWSGFFAVEFFSMKTLPMVNDLAGSLVSRIAGYAVGSSVGATLLGGLIAGGITGIALAVVMEGESDPTKEHLSAARVDVDGTSL